MATNGLASASPAERWIARAISSLPGPALPFDQHRGVGAGHLPDHREDPPHLRALPEELPEPGGRFPAGPRDVLPLQMEDVQRPLQDDLHLFEIGRFEEIVERPQLDRLQGVLLRLVPRDDDHLRAGIDPQQLLEAAQPFLGGPGDRRQPQVQQDERRVLLPRPLERPSRDSPPGSRRSRRSTPTSSACGSLPRLRRREVSAYPSVTPFPRAPRRSPSPDTARSSDGAISITDPPAWDLRRFHQRPDGVKHHLELRVILPFHLVQPPGDVFMGSGQPRVAGRTPA